MDERGFRKYLAERSYAPEDRDAAVELAAAFEALLAERGADVQGATAGDVDRFSQRLIGDRRNTFDNYIVLARYGLFAGNRDVYVANVAYLDGAEAYGNLHARVAERYGASARDAIFAGAEVPPLGTPLADKATRMAAVVERLQDMDPDACRKLVGTGLRDLDDAWYADEKARFDEAGSVDAYLVRRRGAFIAELEEHRTQGKWWFGQEVTDEMLAYVRAHPEVGGGVREGRIVYESKIPYQTQAHVAAKDDASRRFAYCHCPWARASLLPDLDVDVPPVFCNCSAAFHKKPWEVVLGRRLRADVVASVLAGDDRCRFAIHLPDDVVLSDPAV